MNITTISSIVVLSVLLQEALRWHYDEKMSTMPFYFDNINVIYPLFVLLMMELTFGSRISLIGAGW
jgi:hypothetical protein